MFRSVNISSVDKLVCFSAQCGQVERPITQNGQILRSTLLVFGVGKHMSHSVNVQ